jgi:hypothetical protein
MELNLKYSQYVENEIYTVPNASATQFSSYDEFIDHIISLLYQVKEHLRHDYDFSFTDVPPSWGAAAWDRIEELNIVQTR